MFNGRWQDTRPQCEDVICLRIYIRGEGESVKLNILTCSEDVGKECVEWEVPLVYVAEGAAAVGKECRNVGKWGSGDVC
jgi:hypothetical protein